ncbi:MAG: hypothetical protein ABIG70_08430 [Pseudomonadota bacterium]
MQRDYRPAVTVIQSVTVKFALDDSRITGSIREAASVFYQPGCTLYFVDTDLGGEWWLMLGDELIEAFWL